MEEIIQNVQSLQENMDSNDVNNYKESMNEYLISLQLKFQDLSKSIMIK